MFCIYKYLRWVFDLNSDEGKFSKPRWRQQMEAFSALLALCAGNSPVTGEFPSQRPVREALMYSFICAWTNGWVNTREAGDLRRHRAHYVVPVMNFRYE